MGSKYDRREKELNTQNTLIHVYFNHNGKGNQQYQITIPINDKAEKEDGTLFQQELEITSMNVTKMKEYIR